MPINLLRKCVKVGDEIKVLDEQLKIVEDTLNQILLGIPNIPHESVPVGETEDENIQFVHWGEKPQFGFEAKPHWDLADD